MFIWVMWHFVLYFYIGYTYVCWMNYREGAGFPESPIRHGFISDDVLPTMCVLLWPLAIFVHILVNVCIFLENKFKVFTSLEEGISPSSFYKRGKRDNDVNLQAERHLLMEKKPWYRFGR